MKAFSATPVISAGGVYAAGDAVGGLLTFENVCPPYVAEAFILGAALIDLDKESDLLTLLLFDRAITPTADNSPIDPSDADLAYLIAAIPFPAASYIDFNASSACAIQCQIPIVLIDNGVHLYGQLVSGATPTYTAVGDLTVKLFLR